MAKKKLTVPAECHSDDHLFQTVFDAATWFEQAADEHIVALAKCGWGGDYAADDVALFMESKNEYITGMFTHINNVNKCNREHIGFECHVDGDAALLWLRENRPNVAKAITRTDKEEVIYAEAKIA